MLTEVERAVLAHIDADEVVRWTQELVRIPSVYRPKQGETEEPAARWVQERLHEMGLTTTWEEAAPKRPNVISIWEGGSPGKTLMYEGHTDVVTEGNWDQWTLHPFSGEIVDGKIYGRGSNDMKGGLVAAMCALKAIMKSGVRLQGNILLGALADEEGLMLGVKHFVRQGWAEKVDAAVICEPEDNRLCIAQKGVMWVRVKTSGKMSHGAMPLTGINAVYPLGPVLNDLRLMEAAEIKKHGSHEFLGQPSITPTIIQSPVSGEPQNNVMPAE
ncbi:MAG: M20 family metallopeptidase, partial [Chloroflexi bacterium]|nr:M20 family metallopeptidase [Chloroflexota bacterium]